VVRPGTVFSSRDTQETGPRGIALPATGETIRMTSGPDGIEAVSHPDAIVSFVGLDAMGGDAHADQCLTFCHHVFFLASVAVGSAWVAQHPGSFLLSLEQAFELGQTKERCAVRKRSLVGC